MSPPKTLPREYGTEGSIRALDLRPIRPCLPIWDPEFVEQPYLQVSTAHSSQDGLLLLPRFQGSELRQAANPRKGKGSSEHSVALRRWSFVVLACVEPSTSPTTYHAHCTTARSSGRTMYNWRKRAPSEPSPVLGLHSTDRQKSYYLP